MKSGDTVYIASFTFNENNYLENTKVLEGRYISQNSDKDVKVELNFLAGKQTVVIPYKNILATKEDAEKRIYALLAHRAKEQLNKKVSGNVDFLPRNIAKLTEIFASSNPLRFGEPQITFSAQTNTWGEDDNPQKLLQIAGAIWEDIEMLEEILFVLSYANDYAKKLIGKYIVIELNSMFSVLQRLSKLDNNYEANLFPALQKEITILESKFRFKAIRNKIAAHRDSNLDLLESIEFWQNITRYSITKYIEIFTNHLNNILENYPDESALYFTMRTQALQGIKVESSNNAYKFFDDDLDFNT